jgi:hypothetical protein
MLAFVSESRAQGVRFVAPTPGMKLHEYQRKGLTRKAFRNWLILKDTILGCFVLSKGRNGSLEEKKAGARFRSSRRIYLQK